MRNFGAAGTACRGCGVNRLRRNGGQPSPWFFSDKHTEANASQKAVSKSALLLRAWGRELRGATTVFSDIVHVAVVLRSVRRSVHGQRTLRMVDPGRGRAAKSQLERTRRETRLNILTIKGSTTAREKIKRLGGNPGFRGLSGIPASFQGEPGDVFFLISSQAAVFVRAVFFRCPWGGLRNLG